MYIFSSQIFLHLKQPKIHLLICSNTTKDSNFHAGHSPITFEWKRKCSILLLPFEYLDGIFPHKYLKVYYIAIFITQVQCKLWIVHHTTSTHIL